MKREVISLRKYFLVARDRQKNDFSIVKLNDKWFLGKDASGKQLRANDLFAIDLVTTQFCNSSEMIQRMYSNGYLTSDDVDLFIAKVGKQNGKNCIYTCEVLYNPKKDFPIENERMITFREIANSFLNKKESDVRNQICLLYDKFCSKMFYCRDFSSFIYHDSTRVPRKIVDYFYSLKDLSGPAYEFKFKESWVLKSYFAIRSVVDAFNQYDKGEQSFLDTLHSERKKIYDRLLLELDPSYIEGQMSLFDDLSESKYLEKAESSVLDSSINVVHSVIEPSEKEKKSQILLNLYDLPVDVFTIHSSKVHFRTDFFTSYPNEEDKKLLCSLRDKELTAIYFYALHNSMYHEAYARNENTLYLEEELRSDLKKVSNCLKNSKSLDRVFYWTRAYQRAVDYSSTYFTDKEENKEGKVFSKKYDEVC